MLICKCCKISTSLLDSCTWEFWSFKKANLRRFFNYNNQLIYCLFIYLFSRQLFFKLKIKRNRVDLLYWNNQHFGQKKKQLLNQAVSSVLKNFRNHLSWKLSWTPSQPRKWYTVSIIPMNTFRCKKGFIMEQCRLWNMDHVSREQP